MLDPETVEQIDAAAFALPIVEKQLEHIQRCLSSWHDAVGHRVPTDADLYDLDRWDQRRHVVEGRRRDLMYVITSDPGLKS